MAAVQTFENYRKPTRRDEFLKTMEANVHDKHPLPDLLHSNEQRVYGDSAYASQMGLIACKAVDARDFSNQRTRYPESLMRRCVPKTATSQRYFHAWSMSLAWSSACGDLARCVTVVCRRTSHGR